MNPSIYLKRCNRAACIQRMQNTRGLGTAQQAFCNANGVCIDRHIACKSSVLYIRLPCLRVLRNLSTCFPKFENHFAIETVCFQVQLEADGYFFAQEVFAFAFTASRASWYQLAIFESDFTNPASKTLVGLRPNPIFSTKLRWMCILSSKGIMTHKGAGTLQPSLFLPKFSSPFLATRRKWRIFKSFCWHSSIFVVVYSNNLI